MAEIDSYLKVKGVDGESKKDGHTNEIELLSWSWGVTNSSGVGHGTGSAVGKPVGQDLVVSFHVEKSAPPFAKKCIEGVHYDEVVLSCRKSGEGQQDYLKWTLKEAYVTSVQFGGGSGGDVVVTASLTYGDIEMEYKPQDEKGKLGGAVKAGWDVKKAKAR